MKKILIGSVVVVGVVAVAGAVAVNYLLDGETIAQELQKEAKTRFNRDLTFAGPIDIKIFPKIAIELPATTLSYANSDKAQVTLNSARVGVMVLPLLKGEVKLDAVKIDGLKGKINVARLKAALDKKQASASVEAQPSQANAVSGNSKLSFVKDLSVQSIDVFNSGVTVYGLQNKKIYVLDNVNLSTGSIALHGETNVRFSADFAEKTQNLKGNVGIDTQLVYDLKTLGMSLEKFAGHVSLNPSGETMMMHLTSPSIRYEKGDVLLNNLQVVATAPNSSELEASMQVSSTNGMTVWRLDNLSGLGKTSVNEKLVGVRFSGKLQAQTTTETVAATLSGHLGKSPFAIQMQSVGFAKPGVTGKVSLDQLVVADWIGAEKKQTAALSGLHVIENAWADTKTDLSVLNALDANVDVKVGAVQYQGLTVQEVSSKVLLQKGKLSVKDAKAQLCGGTIAANASVDQASKWSVNAQTSKLATQCLASGLNVKPMLEGVATAKVSLAGIGVEPTAIKKTANGTLTAQVDNAVLKGISLEKVASAVRAKDWTGLIVNPNDTTKLSTLSMKATVKNGELCVTNLTGKSSVAEVSGTAKVGLLTDALNGKVQAKLATSVDGRRVTVPINLGGTLQEPTYQLDVGSALKTQLKEELKNPDLLLKGLNKLLKR